MVGSILHCSFRPRKLLPEANPTTTQSEVGQAEAEDEGLKGPKTSPGLPACCSILFVSCLMLSFATLSGFPQVELPSTMALDP